MRKVSIGIFFVTILAVTHPVDIREINFSSLIQVKTGIASIWRCYHEVYFNKIQGFYYKLWKSIKGSEPNYLSRCEAFYNIFKSGAFDEIAPLAELIFNDGLCCGYITQQCESLKGLKNIKWVKRASGVYLELSINQPEIIIQYWERLLAAYLKTGYIILDSVKIDNLGFKNGRIYLIDLDDTLKEEEFKDELASWKQAFFVPWYGFFNANLSRSKKSFPERIYAELKNLEQIKEVMRKRL